MKANTLIGMKIIDTRGNNLGKVDNLEIDEHTGLIESIDVKEKTDKLASEDNPISFSEIDNIVDSVLVNLDKD
ncbi:PRC-barrel domain protein [Methanobrevibacter cuticularis]|uniref:PRC-barrel domain protein n=1 Tax=Methanobrevibacter cuticularis TaxID=47311 RepID=A0A166F6M2_9EURY|nr:PRC-barrel domain-containing protein [Methanobrevibacter cuticularis]KZX17368.1 PRC-barrel domain protein [Methanobrevibacter cuticularis]